LVSNSTLRTLFAVIAKIAITVGSLYVLFQKLELKDLAEFRIVSPAALALAASVAVGLVILQAYRWFLINRSVAIEVTVRKAIISVWFGHFLNNILPTSTAGDVIRNFTLKYEGNSPGRWVGVLICEKYVAVLTALVMSAVISAMAALPGMPNVVKATVLGVLVSMILGYFVLRLLRAKIARFLPHRIRTYLSETVTTIESLFVTRYGRIALAVSLIANLSMAFMFWLAAAAVGVPLNIEYALFVVPVFSVIASLPISYGGWGVRELSAVHLLSFLGVAPDAAFAVSVLYGLVNLSSCIPGVFLGRNFLRTTRLVRSAHKSKQSNNV
jgi:glycosyltransferase 2 family protein